MKILLLNGSPHKDGATKRALLECSYELSHLGDEPILYDLGSDARHTCISCGACSRIRSCAYGDIEELITLFSECSGAIIGTPTHYGLASGTLISVLSRVARVLGGELSGKPVAAVAVGRRGALTEAAGDALRPFRFTGSLIINASYPSIAYGKDKASLEGDTEGLMNMRNIAAAMHRASSILGRV